ncbi:MAG: bifunctional folylpolyglutamate synthase/dihydrofolate synthase, partial [Gaiellaceae bacterium]
MRSTADTQLAWLESLSPWPEEFGLERIRELLRKLGDPQRRFKAIHVVGTNGKTTTVRFAEALLLNDGVDAGAYTSPHVGAWAERIRVAGEEADLGAALGRVRADAEAVGATQFEVLTAAALAEFAAAEVDVAVVEAGLGGRHDATNVLEAPVVVLTNVSLEHTDVLGATREEIAAEKLAVVRPGAQVVLGEPEWDVAARAAGAAGVTVVAGSSGVLAQAAVECFLGRTLDQGPLSDVVVPGRLERVGESPLEIRDGAHNLAGVGYLLTRVPRADWVLVVSILEDKDTAGMLAALS